MSYINICNKAVPCTVYPDCSCKSFDYKKIMCRKFPNCSDNRCIYAHEELASKYKTKMCEFNGIGCANMVWCPFAHSIYDLRKPFENNIKGYTFLPEYMVFERNHALNPEIRLLSKKLDKIIQLLEHD